MNKYRRAEIKSLLEELEEVQGCFENLMDEEQESLDNMPENLLGSSRCIRMYNIIEDMEEAIEHLIFARHIIKNLEG